LLILLLGLVASAQDLNDLRIEKVAGGFVYAEGPAWSHEGYLVFSDIPANKIFYLIPGRPVGILRENSNGSNGHAFDVQGRQYTCETHSRRVVRADKKGKIEILAERFQGKRFNAPSHIVVRKDGQIYFTDPAFGNQQDTRDLDFYGVFHISPKGELSVVAKPKGRPSGIAISGNGKILYVVNSDDRNVRAYDLDHNGAATNERVLISGIGGVPQGICGDENGNLYVAANQLGVYTAEGKLLAGITMNETPSACAFGDADLGTMYITARSSLYKLQLNVKGSVQN